MACRPDPVGLPDSAEGAPRSSASCTHCAGKRCCPCSGRSLCSEGLFLHNLFFAVKIFHLRCPTAVTVSSDLQIFSCCLLIFYNHVCRQTCCLQCGAQLLRRVKLQEWLQSRLPCNSFPLPNGQHVHIPPQVLLLLIPTKGSLSFLI